jgi:hypothetical protein
VELAARPPMTRAAPSSLASRPGPPSASPSPTTAESTAGLTSFAHAPGTMMIHLAMDDLPAWAAPTCAASLRPPRPVARPDGGDLPAGAGRPASLRAVGRRGPAHDGRCVPGPRGQARPLGCRCAWSRHDPRRRQGRDRGHRLGRGGRALRRARARPPRILCAGNPVPHPGPPHRHARGARGRQPESRGRRPSDGEPSPLAALPLPAHAGHADGSTPVPGLS